VDYVKIDGTFITDVHQTHRFRHGQVDQRPGALPGPEDRGRVRGNLDIVPALREIGIDYLQGWGIGMPRTLSEVTELELETDLET
jgi:EAL domain-containing protein (putative c-di-GMP-specific phosphodiesterase class I)